MKGFRFWVLGLGQKKTAVSSNPDHSGLKADGWNLTALAAKIARAFASNEAP